MTSTDARPTEVEYDPDAYKNISDVYRHEDGSLTYIVWDEYGGEGSNPREDDGNVATLVQRNDRCIALDEGDELSAAWDNFKGFGAHGTTAPTWGRGERSKHDREYMINRYIAMFRPDILLFVEHWSAGDSYGWGYVTRAAWDEAMRPPTLTRPQAEDVLAGGDVVDYSEETVRKAFDAEVRVYGQWANNEIYGAHNVIVGDPIVKFWDHGAYIDGYETDEDSCWGFLGYDDHKDIAANFTDSPITEVLA